MADPVSFLIENVNGHPDSEIFGDDSSKVKTFSFSLDGSVTDVVFCDYNDKQFLVISQFQKIGTLLLATKGPSRNLNGISEVYEIKTVCGLDSEDYHLAARYLAQQLNIVKPVLFGISLRDVTPRTLQGISKVLKENLFN